jgi:hypothetical protein
VTVRNTGLADAMPRLKGKAKKMVRERVVLRRERKELQGDNKRLFGELHRSKATEAPMAAKHHDSETRLAMADAGRAVLWRRACSRGSPGWWLWNRSSRRRPRGWPDKYIGRAWGPYGHECGATEPGAGRGAAAGWHQGRDGGWLSLQVVMFKSSSV